MPPKKKSKPARRCSYYDGRVQCRSPGAGNPSLCRAHEELMYEDEPGGNGFTPEGVNEMIDTVFQNSRVASLFEKIATGIDKVAKGIDWVSARRTAQGADPGPTPGPAHDQPRPHQPPPRQPPPRPQQTRENPRVVLGFPPNEVLTEEKIKARRKQLAKIFHGDAGGSEESMKKLNAATDVLLSEVRHGK